MARRAPPVLIGPRAGAHASWPPQRAWAPGATPLPSAAFSYLKVIRDASCLSCLDCPCRWLPLAVAVPQWHWASSVFLQFGPTGPEPRATHPVFYHPRQRGAAAGALQPLATVFQEVAPAGDEARKRRPP